MKFAILSATVAIEPIDYNLFVDNIKSKKRNIEVLQNSDYDIRILATAAPSCYADIIAKRDMFDVSLATAFPESCYYENFENKGEVKKESVLHYLKSIGYSEIDMHVTDHIDDLPLMKIAKRNLLVSPSNLLKSQLAEQQINFEIIQ